MVSVMRLRVLLPVTDSKITLEIAGVKEEYDSRSAVPEDRMYYVVQSIKGENQRILVKLTKPERVPTLEEQGYSFEVGV